MSKKSCTFAAQKLNNTKHMDAAVRQPIMEATISKEKWDSLHTVDELDSALKKIIHNHFHA